MVLPQNYSAKNYLWCEKILRSRFTQPTPKRSASANEPYIAIEIGITKVTYKTKPTPSKSINGLQKNYTNKLSIFLNPSAAEACSHNI